MGTMTNLLIVFLCINIGITMVGLSVGGDDIVNRYATNSGGSLHIAQETNNSIPTTLSTGTLSSGTGGFGFVDTVKMVWNFILMIFKIAFAPLYWGGILGFPSWLQLLMIPYSFVFVLSLILAIRGIGS